MAELSDQHNASALVAAYIDGLESAATQAARARLLYIGALRAAAAAARNLRRD
jgi:hypothetical protein